MRRRTRSKERSPDRRTRAVGRLAAGQDFGAFLHRVVDQFDDLVAPFLVDQRTKRHAVVETVAHLQPRHFGGQLFGEFVVHFFMHIEPVRRGAGFAHIAHLRDHGAVDRRINVGVIEHDEGGIAAEFHRRPDDVVGGFMQELPADFGRAGERHDAYARIVKHRAHDFAGRARGNNVDDARRYASLLENRHQRQHGEWRVRCRLEHHRTAGGERGTDLAGRHRGGKIPRRHQHGDARGLVMHEDARAGSRRHRILSDIADRLFGEPAEEFRRIRDLAARIR